MLKNRTNALLLMAFLFFGGELGAQVPGSSGSVLVVGDSHTVQTFGRTLDEGLRLREGSRVHTVGSCGSVPRWFFTGYPTPCGYFERDAAGASTRQTQHATPLFPQLIQASQPNLVVIAQGSNFIRGYQDSSVRAQIREMLGALGLDPARKCLWVGPPSMRMFSAEEFDRAYRALADEIGDRCVLFDSRSVTQYPAQGGDGVHYDGLGESGKEMARRWAQAVLAEVEKVLQ